MIREQQVLTLLSKISGKNSRFQLPERIEAYSRAPMDLRAVAASASNRQAAASFRCQTQPRKRFTGGPGIQETKISQLGWSVASGDVPLERGSQPSASVHGGEPRNHHRAIQLKYRTSWFEPRGPTGDQTWTSCIPGGAQRVCSPELRLLWSKMSD